MIIQVKFMELPVFTKRGWGPLISALATESKDTLETNSKFVITFF